MTEPEPEFAGIQRRLDRERTARREAEAIAERSIAALHERQRQLEVLEAVAGAANQAETAEEALRVTLERAVRPVRLLARPRLHASRGTS